MLFNETLNGLSNTDIIFKKGSLKYFIMKRKRSGSVIECLTQDEGPQI